MKDLARTVAIVGAAESDELGVVPTKSALQHHAEAASNALADAGLTARDVDGLFTAGLSTLTTGEYLGIRPHYTDSTSIGGSSFVVHIAHALAAINAGFCEVALITHGQTGRSARVRSGGGGLDAAGGPNAEFEWPYGIVGPPVGYGMACSRYMHQYGEDRTRQALAEIAVATRKWAQMNPKALMRDPLSFEDYHNSRWIAWPFHLLDCCLVTDAGAAVVITTAERARDLPKPPIWVLGAAEHHDHYVITQMPDLTVTPAHDSGPRALAMAGVTLRDLDLTMIYDSFTYTVLVTLESLGFCGPGEGPELVANQRTAPGGDFPLNTSGGGLSYTHPGMYGIFLVVEAVRQLRGEVGTRQVPDCKLALVNGTGGFLSSTGTVVLAAD
jgi:acetyl-CoA acetyltransferase